MAAWAKNHSGYAAIHVLSHGAPGEIFLGTSVLDAAGLASQAETLAAIGKALTSDGDLLLYGCEVAAGEKGQDFIEQLAQRTGADMAASDDLTGQGGDWRLEHHVGPVGTEALAVAGYAHGLAPGRLVLGDGSGGGSSGGGYYLSGGNGGGDADLLGPEDATGYAYAGDDVLFGDGSGGGGGPNTTQGYGGSGSDTLNGGAGNDILFGDGFNGGASPTAFGGGDGGLGGGGGYGFTVYPGSQSILGLGAKEGGIGGDGGLGGGGGGGGGAGTVGGGPGTGGKGGRGGYGGYGGYDGGHGGGLMGGYGGAAYGSDDEFVEYIDGAPYVTPAGLGGGGFGSKPGEVQGDNSIHVLPDDAAATLYRFVLQKLPDVFIDNPNLQLPYGGRTASGYGAGSDVLSGGPGSDQLFGLGGNDAFELSDDDTDTVWDFDRNGEADQLKFTAGGFGLDDAGIGQLLASQSADGTDRRLTWRDDAGHGLTVVLKNIGRDLVAADFLTTALPGIVGDDRAPSAVSATLTTPEDTPRILGAADLGYSDPDHDPLAALIPVTLPAAGVLQVSQDGVTWTQAGAGQSIAAAALDAGHVRFLPAAEESGPGYARFDFQLSDGQLLSDIRTLSFDVTAVDDPPRPGFLATYTEGQGPLHLYAALSLIDTDGGGIAAASVTIESVQKGDRLAVNTVGTPLRAEYDPHSGVLTLSGGAELADYQQVLRTLGYSSQADIVSPELRVLSLTLTNGSGAYQVDLTPFSLEPSILSGTALGDRLRGTPADDELRGLAGKDRLDGLGGDDLLEGGQGGDTLEGGTGRDTLWGGADRWVWTSALDSPAGAGRDRVQDFRPKQGDRLDLSALDADTQRPGDQPFSYIGAGEFSAAGQLRYVYDADSRGGLLAGDTDGDGRADFEIGLVGTPTLPAETLVL